MNWIQRKWFMARGLWWMLRLQGRLAKRQPHVWRDVPLDLVALYASFDARKHNNVAWARFIQGAQVEKHRRLTKLRHDLESELADAGY